MCAAKTPQPRKPRQFRYLESTPVRRKLCHGCRHWTLMATAEGLPVTVEVRPIDRVKELPALIRGLATYALLAGGTLAHRDQWRIAGGLIGRGIYVQHQCVGGLDGRD
jgi:hypothetical protein